MASDPGVLGPDHIYVTSVEAGVWPRSGLIPTLDSITPTSCPLGPPSDVVLVATGSGFADTAAIGFGLQPDGTPRYEATVHEADGTLTTVISAGYFPGADAAVPVLVGNEPPHGPTSTVLTFQIGP